MIHVLLASLDSLEPGTCDTLTCLETSCNVVYVLAVRLVVVIQLEVQASAVTRRLGSAAVSSMLKEINVTAAYRAFQHCKIATLWGAVHVRE